MFKNSRYTPEIYGWSEDLEKSITRYDDGYRLRKDNTGKPYLKPMRYADDTYCELGRFSHGERTTNILMGTMIFFGGLLCIFTTVFAMWITVFIDENYGGIFFLIGVPPIAIFFYIYLKGILVRSLMLPADIPIRFNRKTGKVYVYDPKLNKNYVLYPWKVLMGMSKPDIKIFDWENLSAFSRRKGLVKELWLAACKPGTYEVIDYFIVCDSPALHDEWLWIMEYMEFARELSYQSEIPPTHWVNGLNRRFAPPIIWPEGVDKASKAHSKEELMQIEQKYGLVDKMYPDYIIDEVPRDKSDV